MVNRIFQFLINFKPILNPLLITKRLFQINEYWSDEIIITRTACLGNDALKLIDLKCKFIKHQKCRIDYLNEIIRESNRAISFSSILKRFVPRTDIYDLYLQQVFPYNFEKGKSPKCIILDSFSELTDQKFISKSNSKEYFYLNFTDLSKDFDTFFDCLGLLSTKEFEKQYFDFFSMVSIKWPSLPIVFINFPKKLENREVFIERHDLINRAVNKLVSSFPNLKIINIPDEVVKPNPNDNFPYHYSHETYEYVANQIKGIIIN
jgi:hypothetical protein